MSISFCLRARLFFAESLLGFVASTARTPGGTNVVEGCTASGRSARAIFPRGRQAFVAAATAAAAEKMNLHMVLFCGERPLQAFLPQGAAAAAKVS